MTRVQLESWLESHGYARDKFGHYQKTGLFTYRFKMQATSVRYERKAQIVDHNEWLRIKSGYYKDLSITADNKLAGLKTNWPV